MPSVRNKFALPDDDMVKCLQGINTGFPAMVGDDSFTNFVNFSPSSPIFLTVDLLGPEFLEAVKTGDSIAVHEDGTVEIHG